MTSILHSAMRRLVFDDDGQDLVEYALLTGAVGLAGFAVYGVIRNNMAESYTNWIDADTPGSLQYNWEPPPPTE
jgi:Flp pilus assembly pilin Flp